MLLSGWKEIANYLRSGVRTVQRWERDGLPVMRPRPGARGHVVAYTLQLDAWVKRSRNGHVDILSLQTERERTRQLLVSLSKERVQMRLRLAELRREIASLRTRHIRG
jgi:phage terminase Nu1 subunit (DNA packaging protein)